MNRGISLAAVGHASSLFLAITFALCVGFDLLFPEHAMYKAWRDLLAGFEWLSWRSFFSRSGRILRVWVVFLADLGAPV